MKQDRCRDVIRDVADKQITRPAKLAGIGLEDVRFHNLDARRESESLAQQCGERAIELDCHDTARTLHENVSERAAARSDLQHRVGLGRRECVDDSCKRALIRKKVLAQSLERGRESITCSRDQLRSTTRVRSSRGGMSPVCWLSASNTRSTITAAGSVAWR